MTTMTPESSILPQVWQQLQGNCTGVAVFATRQPAVFIDIDGVLQVASHEMLYSEEGDFAMTATPGATNMPKFSFSRRYVWRLQDDKTKGPELSVWFVKPGTESIDYLFHKVLLQHITSGDQDGRDCVNVECSGGHLCVEDYYSSIYTFTVEHDGGEPVELKSWSTLHEVRGPKKDQVIETTFSRV